MKLTLTPEDASSFAPGNEIRLAGDTWATVLWYLKRPLQWLGILPRQWVIEVNPRLGVIIIETKRFPTYE